MFDAQIPIYGVYYVYMQFGSYSQLLPYIYIYIDTCIHSCTNHCKLDLGNTQSWVAVRW